MLTILLRLTCLYIYIYIMYICIYVTILCLYWYIDVKKKFLEDYQIRSVQEFLLVQLF